MSRHYLVLNSECEPVRPQSGTAPLAGVQCRVVTAADLRGGYIPLLRMTATGYEEIELHDLRAGDYFCLGSIGPFRAVAVSSKRESDFRVLTDRRDTR